MFRKKLSIHPDRIIRRTLRKTYPARGREIMIELEGAMFAPADEGRPEMLLDESLVNQMLQAITASLEHHTSKYNPMPDRIIISRGEEKVREERAAAEAETAASAVEAPPAPLSSSSAGSTETRLLEAKEPRYKIDDVQIGQASRASLDSALAIIRHYNVLYGEWGLEETMKSSRALAFNFYGPPGTGKSMMAEAVAGSLDKKVLLVNYAELESKYVGETPKNIRMAFQLATEQDAVLVFDEADSFLGKRLTNVQQSSDYGVNITRSVMLMELERFGGVVVFTTNLLQNYDEAFRRRILAQIGFTYPDEQSRAGIWQYHLPGRMPRSADVTLQWLAAAFTDITGADIKDMVLFAAAHCLRQGEREIRRSHMEEAYETVMQRYAAAGGFPGKDGSCEISHEAISREQYERETGGTG